MTIVSENVIGLLQQADIGHSSSDHNLGNAEFIKYPHVSFASDVHGMILIGHMCLYSHIF